ncbi:MAG: DUF924 domain-containing protein [Synechococcaceae cyanobacterium RM1_1_27]|nr:DUF924 domain-containing protein [Synechococcaceae cyanobacterium RM1_1_27]
MFDPILTFWFDEIAPAQWWKKDPSFDQLIADRFGDLLRQAAQCELYEWRSDPRGRLAEVIVLDQFSRNIYRDSPLAFAQDALALGLAQEALRVGADYGLTPTERSFLLMPFMHSESLLIHELAVGLFEKNGIASNYDYELAHKAIIERFGRYPHRNQILGRVSTAEEVEFLQQPGSSF